MQVTDATYNGTRVDYSAYQHVPFPPALYIDLANSNHQGDSLFGFLPPLLNPSADQHYTQDQLPSVTPEHNHFSPQPTLMVAHRPSARRHTGALASDPVGGAGSKATEMPAGSSLVNDVGFQTSRKRKPAVALDEARQVKRTRRPAQVGIIQFGPTQKRLITALFLDGPSCYSIHTPSSPHSGTVSVPV